MEKQTKKLNPPFEIVEVNISTGETLIALQKGILGSMSKQLKNTDDFRSCANILRKLGHMLADCGDLQYGGAIEDTNLKPEVVTDIDHV
jgi:hypothetical protein